MANLVEPEEVFNHFLRSRVSEITRTGVTNRLTSNNETFDGTGAQTVYTLSSAVDSIVTVLVDSVEVYPYKDFEIDLDNKKITFNTAPASGTDNVDITYNNGIAWVYPDSPRDDLSTNSYPRIGTIPISESSIQESIAENDTFDSITFQVDILAYKDQFCTIATEQKSGNDVARILARTVKATIKSDWRLYLNTKLMQPTFLSGPTPIPFEPAKNTFRNMLEISFNAFNTGE